MSFSPILVEKLTDEEIQSDLISMTKGNTIDIICDVVTIFANLLKNGFPLNSELEEFIFYIFDNFYENQFSLAKKYPETSYEDWVKILKHAAFDTWKQEQIAIIASTATDKALAGAELGKDSLQLLRVRQDVLDKDKRVEKPTIIVMPTELFFREDDDG